MVAAIGLWALAPGPASAVLIRDGDGSGNTSAPADDPGWANVGSVGGCTGVYLGGGWVLTAAHVWRNAPSVAYFNGGSYAIQAGSEHRLHEPLNTSPVDLELFRLAAPPADLPNLAISALAPLVGSKVTGIGNGRDRAAAETWWDSDWNHESGTEAYRGFVLSGGTTKRWGENNIAQRGFVLDDGYGKTYMLKTVFDYTGGSSEMQAAAGDSGGALFYENAGTWELSGLILAVNALRPGQPANSVLYGDATYYADLSRYRTQIAAITSAPPGPNSVPEPSSVVMLAAIGLTGMGWCVYRRVRRGQGSEKRIGR